MLSDKKNNPLTPFILWKDNRATVTEQLKQLSSSNNWLQKTGIGSNITSYYAISKIQHIQRNDPQLWHKTYTIKTIADYLTLELCGHSVVDTSTASLSGLMDVRNGCWWQDALEMTGINKTHLPQPEKMGTRLGFLTKQSSQKIGLNKDTLFMLGGLDHHIAAIGAGINTYNEIAESTGTVIAAVKISTEYKPEKDVFLSQAIMPDEYYKMAFDENGITSIERYQKEMAPALSLDELLIMAAEVPAGCDGLIAMPCMLQYEGLSGFRNIKTKYHHGHFIRAIMESVSHSLHDLIHRIAYNEKTLNIYSTGGGASLALLNRIKGLTNKHYLFKPAAFTESACAGAAMIASAGSGHFKDIAEAQAHWAKK